MSLQDKLLVLVSRTFSPSLFRFCHQNSGLKAVVHPHAHSGFVTKILSGDKVLDQYHHDSLNGARDFLHKFGYREI